METRLSLPALQFVEAFDRLTTWEYDLQHPSAKLIEHKTSHSGDTVLAITCQQIIRSEQVLRKTDLACSTWLEGWMRTLSQPTCNCRMGFLPLLGTQELPDVTLRLHYLVRT